MKLSSILTICASLVTSYLFSQTSTHWKIDNLESIDGNAVSVTGNPTVVEIDTADTPFSIIKFDGDDGIIIDGNPLVGATSFTAEVVFFPINDVPREPRFVHFQQDDDNRVLIELRNFTSGEWYLDTFIKSSGVSSPPLIDENNTHDTDSWHHAALIYSNGKMSHYVDGVLELEGDASYSPMSSGKVSLGMRMNNVNHFNGYIKELRVTDKVLDPSDFLINEDAEEPVDTTDTIIMKAKDGIKGAMIFPNPSTGECQLSINLPFTAKYSISATDVSGRSVMSESIKLLTKGENKVGLDFSSLQHGLYNITISAKTFNQNLRLKIE